MSEPIPIRGDRPESRGAPADPSAIPLLEKGRLHEIHCSVEDRAAALSFALAMGQWDKDGMVFVLHVPRKTSLPLVLFGDGLQALGFSPERLTIVQAGSEVDMLRACRDAVRCSGVAAVLMEAEGRFADYDLTASRRLVLAAEASQSCVMLLRVGAEPRSSAAQTRWSITSAPSVPLEAGAPGGSAIHVELLRSRGGREGRSWRLIWDEEHGTYRDAGERQAVPGAVVPLSSLRAGAVGGARRSG